jgi:hypothetical protein
MRQDYACLQSATVIHFAARGIKRYSLATREMNLSQEYFLELWRIRPLDLVMSSGPIGLLAWVTLPPVLAIGVFFAIRGRPAGLYWSLAQLHFLFFVYTVIFLNAVTPCACLTPWRHNPQLLASATVSFVSEVFLILSVGLLATRRSATRTRLALLPLLSCFAITADSVAIWMLRIGLHR